MAAPVDIRLHVLRLPTRQELHVHEDEEGPSTNGPGKQVYSFST